eukprot:CAMPEP_0175046706 /NCGR_PEP_ID=MMETSP0052_2-20121109/5179_1 /TAXON_ID=51329 ORGANISM="Polytomella parva, Strain SAG 63-3" /NCGR_SAMPLE_ID=MMETSP0052_2 /ASSEMBLY_ACC=CAM_ASM_000194 /LENGTH=245 /DNA_ID=CAMNT_0016310481 /DNA_START=208 /DNA_END=942 /DNA_ORIENTATION=+
MSTRQLSRLDISPEIRERLRRCGFLTARDVLTATPLDLQEIADISFTAAHELIQIVCAQTVPPFVTALSLLHRDRNETLGISSGLPTLDDVFGGGLPIGTIIELVGGAGVGKSQFCATAAAREAMPKTQGGRGGSVIYIDAERKFSALRLAEIMNSLAARFALPSTVDYNMVVNQSIPDEAQIPAALARVTVLNPRSSDELLDVVQNLDSTVLRVGARLVILDSIAALARADFAYRGGGVVRGLD